MPHSARSRAAASCMHACMHNSHTRQHVQLVRGADQALHNADEPKRKNWWKHQYAQVSVLHKAYIMTHITACQTALPQCTQHSVFTCMKSSSSSVSGSSALSYSSASLSLPPAAMHGSMFRCQTLPLSQFQTGSCIGVTSSGRKSTLPAGSVCRESKRLCTCLPSASPTGRKESAPCMTQHLLAKTCGQCMLYHEHACDTKHKHACW